MRLDQLTLKQFRNYDDLVIEFSPGINLLIGQNAQGKTNLLEAIYLLSLTKSHRTTIDRELIQWQETESLLKGYVFSKTNPLHLSVHLKHKGKIVSINRLNQSRLSHYIGQLNVILFAPEDLALIKGAPQLRRLFLDREIGQFNNLYLTHSVNYKKILKQRNRYLKDLNRGFESDFMVLEILTEQLVDEAAYLIHARQQFMKSLEQIAQPLHEKISGNREELKMKYHATIPLQHEITLESVKMLLLERFSQQQQKEIDRELTLVGPHREDFSCELNGKDVQVFGSQGQQRSTVLSLKLAEIELAHQLTGEYPLLLLDDVLSELDDDRQTFLLQTIENKVQTFLTTTSLVGINQELVKNPTIFEIKNGKIENGVCRIK